ncbi:hypothetical protein ACCS93_39435, partial [Rhizobium ruizarguesonis]
SRLKRNQLYRGSTTGHGMINGPRILPTPVAKAFARFLPSSHLEGPAGAALEAKKFLVYACVG